MIDVVLTSVKENWKIIGMVCSKIDGSLGDSRLAYVQPTTALQSTSQESMKKRSTAELSKHNRKQQSITKHCKAQLGRKKPFTATQKN